MKIVKLSASNFMRLVAVEISPQGNAIMITGKNAQGKSSILDAIMSVFCGKKYQPQKPIRDGQDHAEVVVETENYIIKRTFTAKGGGSVTVSNAEGMKASSPQGLLDKLVGEIAFEPMAFFKDCRDVKKQRQQLLMLMKLVGLDFDDINADIAKVKQQRSTVKTSKETYDFEAGQIPKLDNMPTELVSMTELTEKLAIATKHNSFQAEQQSAIDIGKRLLESHAAKVEEGKTLIESVKEKLAAAEKKVEDYEKAIEDIQAKQELLVGKLEPLIDITTINDEIKNADAHNDNIRLTIQRTELLQKSAGKSKEFAKLGKDIKLLEAKKTEKLAMVKMPIEGLSVNEDTILFNDGKQGDTPLAQVNESMQLQIAVAISMALNPKLKVILINGNDLDSENLEIVCKLAEAKDYQVWIERIADDDKVGFYIEEGEVNAIDGKKTKRD